MVLIRFSRPTLLLAGWLICSVIRHWMATRPRMGAGWLRLLAGEVPGGLVLEVEVRRLRRRGVVLGRVDVECRVTG